ncbi:MBL fold metallo-hydrolase [Halobacteriovorax marinus]|uniref:MBL fold metallo-hydrolase n=1 Tax=Halobacteriovorax marinus TaxID=97084 RepID=UPI003A90E88A
MSHSLKTFFDKDTYTLTYVVYDENSKDAIIIDPVLDYDPAASKISDESIRKVQDFVNSKSLNVHYILETHAHADHLTGAAELKKRIPSTKIGIGKNITKVQDLFSGVFNLKEFNTNGIQFDVLLNEDETLNAGTIEVKTIFTPGHTPACSSYLIDDMVFTGDALFMPDYGTGRCDFPAGSARDLYHSVHEKLYKLPDTTRVLTGHDYQPNGRELRYESTIGESKESNIQLKETTTEAEFIEFRTKRDATLSAPRLLLPSIQVNIDAGHLPHEEDNGSRYLKIPVRE